MQRITYPPRDALTATQVTNLIQCGAPKISCGLELLDINLNLMEDITEWFIGGSVARAAYADLHGSATITVSRELDWGNAIVRPYVTMTGVLSTSTAPISARFNMGAYFTSTDKQDFDMSPRQWDVDCFDILSLLNDPLSDSFAVAAGDSYLNTVESILLGRGYVQYIIDRTSSAVLPAARVWPITEDHTWLTVVNDLLGSIGYQGIWSDWNGMLRVQPYQPPLTRGPEFYYSMDPNTSIISHKRTRTRDLYNAPNRWVFIQSNRATGDPPTEGDGIYIFQNDANGPTSVDARGGRIITKKSSIDAADQASLVQTAQITINADIAVNGTLDVSTGPNPLHWHFDRMVLNDPDLGVLTEVMGTDWTFPLDGSDMTQTWALL